MMFRAGCRICSVSVRNKDRSLAERTSLSAQLLLLFGICFLTHSGADRTVQPSILKRVTGVRIIKPAAYCRAFYSSRTAGSAYPAPVRS